MQGRWWGGGGKGGRKEADVEIMNEEKKDSTAKEWQ